jgi:hypothetical protein
MRVRDRSTQCKLEGCRASLVCAELYIGYCSEFGVVKGSHSACPQQMRCPGLVADDQEDRVEHARRIVERHNQIERLPSSPCVILSGGR